jgi:molybdopterin molybdotransferase
MVSLHEAKALALAAAEVAPPISVPLGEAHGRFLAEPVRAPRALPSFDNSAMDGYAVRSADCAGANRDTPARLSMVGAIYAGDDPQLTVAAGQAARIFTGAPIPKGADCVVRQEATRGTAQEVLVFVEAEPNGNIRHRGEELEEGATVFPLGERLGAYALGVLASLGFERIPVWPRPTVAILTLGDELVPPGRPAGPSQVYNSNAVALSALCIEAGALVVAAEHAPDREDSVRSALERLTPAADLLITSGGASVGAKDLIKPAARSLGGAMLFDGVTMKPGKPAALVALGGHRVAILPGNSGAAAVAFDQLVRPMLLKRQGVLEKRQCVQARLGSKQHKQGGLTYFLSAKLERDANGPPTARIRPAGSGQLLQNVGAEGWIVLPPGRAEFLAGEEASMELFSGAIFTPAQYPFPGSAASDVRMAVR